MKRIKLSLLIICFVVLNGEADISDAEALARQLNLSAGSKAIIQWERVFKSEKKMKRYKIDLLGIEEQNRLKEYLISHAIDSDQPTVAGEE